MSVAKEHPIEVIPNLPGNRMVVVIQSVTRLDVRERTAARLMLAGTVAFQGVLSVSTDSNGCRAAYERGSLF